MDSQPAAQPFTITGQELRVSPNPTTGASERYWRVSFTTPSGIKSWVDVQQADYTPGKVAQLIAADVANIEGVQALGTH
jgi:hypothetical protein